MSRETIDVYTRCVEVMGEMQHRGLTHGAAWIGEMTMAAPQHLLGQNFEFLRPTLQEQHTAAVKLGECYLQNQEFKRCKALLADEPGFRASFLGMYALYLDGEKQKDVAGAGDFAMNDRSTLAAGATGGATAVSGGGSSSAAFNVDSGGTFSSLGAAATAGGMAGGLHGDVPAGLRKNHHVIDLDRGLTSLVSFQSQHYSNPHHHHHHHHQNTTSATFSASSSDSNNNNNNNNQQQNNNQNQDLHQQGSGSGGGDDSAAASPPLQREHCVDHAYLHWLHGVVRKERGFREEAVSSFKLAVTLEPLLWTAWVDLASVISSESDISNILAHVFHPNRPRGFNQALGWVGQCFSALAKLEMQSLPAAISEYESLLREFPKSAYLQSRLGAARYHRKDWPASREAFETAIHCDPLRLEGLDEFSNLLFVAGDKTRLAALAQASYAVDPFRSETSCVAGNYFAMLRRHAQSVQHFRRAVTIDRKNSSAWTLLGHGYVEVKHTSAAVDAYHTAVAVDQRDYRAWYGLGQIFELLHLYPQALEFYRQTAAVRPHDSRMWSVVAGCLEKQSRIGEAMKCFERAEACEPSSTEFYCTLVRRLADHYASVRPGLTESVQKSASYYAKLLQSPHSSTEDRASALLFLCAIRVFEAFELFEIMPRNQSSIFSLQQQNVPLDMSRFSGGGGTNNNNNNANATAAGGGGGGAEEVSPVPRMLSLPQPSQFHFGRTQPRLPGGEMRKARAATLISEADQMLNHLRDELIPQQGGGNPQLETWLAAYQHDLEVLRSHL